MKRLSVEVIETWTITVLSGAKKKTELMFNSRECKIISWAGAKIFSFILTVPKNFPVSLPGVKSG